MSMSSKQKNPDSYFSFKSINYLTIFHHSNIRLVRFMILTLLLLFYFFIVIKFTSDKVMLNLP